MKANPVIPSPGKDGEQLELPSIAAKNAKRKLTYSPIICLLGVLPRETETYVHIKTCAWMLMTAWIQNCQTLGISLMSVRWYLDKQTVVHLHTVEGCSTGRETWVTLKTYAQWKKTSSKPTCCMSPFIWYSGKGKIIVTEISSVADSGCNGENFYYEGACGNILEGMEMLCLNSVMGTQLCMLVKLSRQYT